MHLGDDQRRWSLWQIVAALLLVFAFGYLAYLLRSALYPLLFGFFLAFAAMPFVKRFEHGRMGRTLATTVVFSVGIVTCAILLFFLITQAHSLVSELFAVDEQGNKVGHAYTALGKLENLYEWADEKIGLGERGKEVIQNLPEEIAASWKEFANTATPVFQFGLSAAGSVFGLLSLLLLTPVFAFLILLEFDQIRAGLIRLFRPESQARATQLLDKISKLLGSFLRGRTITGLIKGGGQTIFLVMIGAPYALLTGLLSWILSFIPFVGPVIAFAPTALLAGLAGEWTVVILIVVILVLGEIIEGYLLIPKIVGPGMGLNTLEILVALLIGGAALGFLGLFLAVPLAAVAKVILTDYLENRDGKAA